jgi:hypothetical protein
MPLTSPWLPFDRMTITRAGSGPGVYELADGDDTTLFIGFAGPKTRGGLRGDLEKHLKAAKGATRYRAEATARYLQRYDELLAAYAREHGTLPPWNVAKANQRRDR